MSEHLVVQPDGWPRPSGYSNGIVASGRIVVIAGQIGWDPLTMKFSTLDFVSQVRSALTNIVTVLNAAGAEARDVVRLTWFVTDRAAYAENAKKIGEVYREVFGKHYPVMSVVVVSALVEADAMVEIEATAVLPA